jgi:hypothetical protein
MANFDLTLRELEKGRLFAIGESHVINATIGKGHLVEMEDLNFHFDSAVLLPDPNCDSDPDKPEQDRITGISVLATCLKHAQEHAREQLLITGHADTKGGSDYNIALSKRRADNVLFALIGDKEGWAKLSLDHHQVEDAQAILKWIDVRFAFGTDPGPIDNANGEKTKAAIKTFKKRYNADFKKNIPVDGSSVGLEGWRAFFDMYMLALKQILETDDAGLDSLRGSLTFMDGANKTVGCGETHPIESAEKDEFRSATNRRVELLFFDSEDRLPSLVCHPSAGKCKPELCQIYGKGLFAFHHIPCGGDTPGFSGSFGEGTTVKPIDGEETPDAPDDPDPPDSAPRMAEGDPIDALPEA